MIRVNQSNALAGGRSDARDYPDMRSALGAVLMQLLPQDKREEPVLVQITTIEPEKTRITLGQRIDNEWLPLRDWDVYPVPGVFHLAEHDTETGRRRV